MTRRDAAKNCAGSTPDTFSVSFLKEAYTLRTLPNPVDADSRLAAKPSRSASPWRRGVGLFSAVAFVLLGLFGLAAPISARPVSTVPAEPAPTRPTTEPGRVSVIKAEGLIDPVMASFIEQSVMEGERAQVIAVVIQLDSGGSVVSDARLRELAATIHNASVPVAVWVGPSGSEAIGGAAQLAGAAKIVGLPRGSRLGKTGPLVVPEDLLSPAFVAAAGRLKGGTINDTQARKLGVAPNRRAAVIGEFIIAIDGVETRVVTVEGRKVTEPVSIPVFSTLPIQDQLFHTVASPAAAYLLLLIGLSLIVFELYTAGVGVAGLVGAGCFVLACYGLAILPVRPVGLGLLVLAILAFTIDVQTGAPRVWSVVGAVSLVAGSVLLFDGLSLSWISLLVGIAGTAAFMLTGMPAMVRTRFSTPTIGREWMIGELGDAQTALSPDGVVRVRGALWRARANQATSIAANEPIRVVEVTGLMLEIEPLEGGAVYPRDQRRVGSEADSRLDEEDPRDGTGVVLVDGKPLPPVDPDFGHGPR